MEFDRLSNIVIGAAIIVHKALGPGLLESAYEACMAHDLINGGHTVERQKPLPLQYKGVRLDCGYRMDMVVDGKIILEIKAVARLEPIHEAQMITYQRLSGIPVGLIINFNVPILKDGIKRIVNKYVP
jgi:GxxExxY protein